MTAIPSLHPLNGTGAATPAVPKARVGQLAAGAFAGVVVAMVAAVVLALLAVARLTRRWPFARRERPTSDTARLADDGAGAGGEKKATPLVEAEGDTPSLSEMASSTDDGKAGAAGAGSRANGALYGEVEAAHKVEMPACDGATEMESPSSPVATTPPMTSPSPVIGRAELEGPSARQELAGQPPPAVRYYKGAI